MRSMLQITTLAIGLVLSTTSNAGTVLSASNSESALVDFILAPQDGSWGFSPIENLWPACGTRFSAPGLEIGFCYTRTVTLGPGLVEDVDLTAALGGRYFPSEIYLNL